MSYHYRRNKEQLYQQLNEVEKDLHSDHNNLQKLKLQAEFYQEKNKPIAQPIPHNQSSLLADQIMNQLIGSPSQQANKYHEKKGPQHSHHYPYEVKTPAPKQELKGSAQRQNNFINQRQLQKNKLQNQKHEGLFPTSSDRNKVRSFGKQPQPIPESDHYQNQPINKAKFPDEPSKYNLNFNPFIKDDEEEKRKKQDRNREYLKVLEEQRLEQQHKKEVQMKEEKSRKEGVYYDYMPSNKGQQKPLIMKKSDPNSKPPKIQLVGNHSRFDRNLIKSKAIQIKSKYKKGKIIYEQYQRQISNLKKQYGGNFQDLLEDKSSAKIEKQIQQQIELNQPFKIEEQLKRPTNNQPEQNGNESSNTTNSPHQIRNENANCSQIIPAFINQPQSYYQNSTLPANMGSSPPSSQLPPNISAQYLEMMRKMFEVCIKQVKQAYQKNNQGQLYQDLMNKMISGSQNNFMPQQHIQASQQKQFFSDAKQQRQYFGKEPNIERINPQSGDTVAKMPYGESDNSQYYDKSLSGIASKLPFNSIGPLKKEAKDIGLDQFYNNRYKIKKLYKFAILIDPNQSQLEIPSISTYMRPKNAKQQRDSQCQSDLIELRKLQSQNRMIELTNKMAKNSIYTSERRILKQPDINPVSSGSPQPKGQLKKQGFLEKNPFLKKHEDNLMTFNEHGLKINSPINKYSPKSKKEILEQDEYQTEPRQRENPRQQSNYYQEYERKINLPATKMLDFVKVNNEIINKKYVKGEDGMKSIAVKQSYQIKDSSKNYFSNNQISPVKRSDNYYDQSLQTIKSDYELANHSPMPVKALDVPKGIQQSQQAFESERLQKQHGMIGYSQTLESIEQSSQKRPSIPKKRSIGKKKQSSIIRSKLNADSAISRSGSMSPSGHQQEEPAKFDSNVYESQYEDSVNYTRQVNINPQMVKNNPKQQREQTHIQINPPFITVPMSTVNIPQASPENEPKAKPHKVASQNKWKSFQEARKIAKQCRVKTIEESKDYRSVEQKFSQLESFITKKDQSILIVKKQTNLSQEDEKSPAKTKRNIMKLLEELQGNDEDEYRQDFQSYRQESEQYR